MTTDPALDSAYVYEIKEAIYVLHQAAEEAAEAVYDMRKNAPEQMTPEQHAAAFVALDKACAEYLARREATREWSR